MILKFLKILSPNKKTRSTLSGNIFRAVLFYLLIDFGQCEYKCLIDVPEVFPKRYPYIENKKININLETSQRATHQLSTHVFKIFAEEILGYARVFIIEHEDNFDIRESMDRLLHPTNNTTNPVPTINLEVWVPPDIDTKAWEIESFAKDCGNVAQRGGRFGWFIPKDLRKPIKNFINPLTDADQINWSFLKDENVVSNFNINDDKLMKYLDGMAVNRNSNDSSYFCPKPDCTNGIFTPKHCKNKECALLLAPDFNSTNFVMDHINELQLNVRVIWLGNNLLTAYQTIKRSYVYDNSYKSLMVLYWTPSELVVNENDFLTVTFKKCELLNSGSHWCKYEMNRLVKFAWGRLDKVTKDLYETLNRYQFDKMKYSELLEVHLSSPNTTYRDSACKWMKQQKMNWTAVEWVNRVKPIIYIGGIFPLHGSLYNGLGIGVAAKMAVQEINRKAFVGNYEFHLLLNDGKCSNDHVMRIFIDYIVEEQYPNLIGILGPACSETVEPLAGVSKHYRTTIISYAAEGATFSDRVKYPYFFRTIGENKNFRYVYLRFFQEMGWSQVAALTEDGQKYTEYLSYLQDLLEKNDITFISNKKFPRVRDDELVLMRNLEDLKKRRSRIIIGDMFEEAARTVMCEAYKLRMTAHQGYVWFLPVWFHVTWYDTDYYNSKKNETVNCTTAQMIKAIEGYFSITHAYFAPDDDIMQENITVGEWRKKYATEVKSAYQAPSDYAGYAYDAVWVYAYAVKKLIDSNEELMSDMHSEYTISNLTSIINETNFNGVSGPIRFLGGPSRSSIINIMQWYRNETHIVGQFFPNVTEQFVDLKGGRMALNTSSMRWFTENGQRPDDGRLTDCVLEGLAKFFNVDCSMAIVILNVMIFFMVLVAVGIAIFKIKQRYENRWKENEFSVLNFSDLDKWEIPRENVVINRKIGEGEFGFVYGGEATFGCEEGEEKASWLAVAVKTLKVKSTPEEKLDFLSEAEVMKRFEHPNIVKLLGVIIKTEPLYTVMEFMLYGDLKTYLLARRHLVNKKSKESSDEVSSKRLTLMALDISRGLSYLAQLKYVHRDLACRNCLVNAHRTVKIGDFGMTRPMSESDYYRFNRRGMLPVRWMSPEALALGLFTPASDVWSFGVLLYEIVTFGSFPFQGMTNPEVLEYVKNGNTLTVPTGISPQLEGLIKSCWNQDTDKRPHAKEIVEFLAINSNLLTPSLDAPLSSVHMKETDELDLTHLEHIRPKNVTKVERPESVASSNRHISQMATPENTVNIPMESYCPKVPLLGTGRSNSSLISFTSLGSTEEEEDYLAVKKPNGQVSSMF